MVEKYGNKENQKDDRGLRIDAKGEIRSGEPPCRYWSLGLCRASVVRVETL